MTEQLHNLVGHVVWKSDPLVVIIIDEEPLLPNRAKKCSVRDLEMPHTSSRPSNEMPKAMRRRHAITFISNGCGGGHEEGCPRLGTA